jgi:Sigma-70, region 4
LPLVGPLRWRSSPKRSASRRPRWTPSPRTCSAPRCSAWRVSPSALRRTWWPNKGPGPEDRLLQRERLEYLQLAVDSLPERLRKVVTDYFLAERPMAEIAAELGVSESRVSQLRAEALDLLRDGMNAQLDPALVGRPRRPGGCVARRREAYYARIAARAELRGDLLAQVGARVGAGKRVVRVA